MERIKAQASKLGGLVTDSQTYAAYQNFFKTTWDILRETGVLLWLGLCLFLVVFEWFWQNSVAIGRNSRTWLNSLDGSNEKMASETGKALLSAGKNSLDFTIATAKQQLGLPTDTTKSE